MIEDEIVTLLKADSALDAVVSGRVYTHPLPQRASLPAVTYQRVSGVPTYTFKRRAGFTVSRFQFNCFGRSPLEAAAACEALIEAMDAFPGIRAMFGPRDFTEPGIVPVDKTTGAPKALVWRTVDFQISHVM